MAEVVGLVSGLMTIAEAGLRLYQTLNHLAEGIASAEGDIILVSTDLKATTSVVNLVREFIQTSAQSRSVVIQKGLATIPSLTDQCNYVFEKLKNLVSYLEPYHDSTSATAHGGTLVRSDHQHRFKLLDKWKWQQQKPKVEILRTYLESLKSNLSLLLSIFNLEVAEERREPEDFRQILREELSEALQDASTFQEDLDSKIIQRSELNTSTALAVAIPDRRILRPQRAVKDLAMEVMLWKDSSAQTRNAIPVGSTMGLPQRSRGSTVNSDLDRSAMPWNESFAQPQNAVQGKGSIRSQPQSSWANKMVSGREKDAMLFKGPSTPSPNATPAAGSAKSSPQSFHGSARRSGIEGDATRTSESHSRNVEEDFQDRAWLKRRDNGTSHAVERPRSLRDMPSMSQSQTAPCSKSKSKGDAIPIRGSNLKHAEIQDSGYGSAGGQMPDLSGNSLPRQMPTRYKIVEDEDDTRTIIVDPEDRPAIRLPRQTPTRFHIVEDEDDTRTIIVDPEDRPRIRQTRSPLSFPQDRDRRNRF